MKALLLCAGLGTGMRPYTTVIPKPAIPLLNVPIAYYSLHLVQQLGIRDIVVNTHHLPQKVKSLFPATLGPQFVFSDEQPKILDTGGAIWQARKHLEGEGFFLVSNTDAARNFALQDAISFHKKRKPLATLIVMEHPEVGTKYGGIWVDSQNQVVGMGKEKPSSAVKGYHYTGIQITSDEVFKYLPEGPSPIWETYRKALGAGEKILVFPKKGLWMDAGSPTEYFASTETMIGLLPRLQHEPIFQSLFRRFWGSYEKRASLWEGEACQHALDLLGSQNILLGNRVKVSPSAQITGFCVLGDDVVIEEKAHLHNCVILKQGRVSAGVQLNQQLVVPVT